MRVVATTRLALITAAALLAGCGGSQPPIAPRAGVQSSVIAPRSEKRARLHLDS